MTDARTRTGDRSAIGFVASGYVLLTVLASVRALFSVKTTSFRIALVVWIGLGIALLWVRWRPKR